MQTGVVLLPWYPAQVSNSIVLPVVVDMVNLLIVVWIRNECFCNQAMHIVVAEAKVCWL